MKTNQVGIYISIALSIALYSIVSTIISFVLLLYITDFIASFINIRSILYSIRSNIGDPEIYYLVFGMLLIFYSIVFYRTNRQLRHYRYLQKIFNDVQEIASGNFEKKVRIESVPILRELSRNINQIVETSKQAIEDERRAEQMKNELITNVSHDLRTPLTSIIGYLGLIEQDRYRDEVELRYYMNIAYEKAERLNHLINDLFAYSRLKSKELPIHKTRIDIVEMLGQLAVAFIPQLQTANMEIRTDYRTKNLYVHADGKHLVRVFENLINNAISYGQEGKYIDIQAYETAQEAIIEIINYGDPIPRMDLPYLFERFYRVEKSRTEEKGGSGLGLAITKSIVELHNGNIAVTSNEERTVFSVTLPKLMDKDG